MHHYYILLTIAIISFANLSYADSLTSINTITPIVTPAFETDTVKPLVTQQTSDYTTQILTGIFSICSMLLGLFFSQLLQRLKQRKANKRSYNLWLSSLQLLQISLHDQVNYLIGYKASYDSHNIITPQPTFYLELENKFITNYTWVDLLQFINMHYKKTLDKSQSVIKLANLSYLLNSTLVLSKRMTKSYKNHINDLNNILIQITPLMNSLNKECFFVFDQLAADKTQIEDYKHSQRLFDLYDKEFYPKFSDPDSNLIQLSEEFIKPFIQYLVNNKLHIRYSTLLEMLTELNFNLRQIVVNNHKFEDSIATFISSFEKNYLQLTHILDRTNNVTVDH